jgi:hypothetical protein
MWKPIYQPEPWPQFVKRKEIAPLPLMEQRRKHMEEQMLFENYISSVNTMNTLNLRQELQVVLHLILHMY